MSSSSQRWESAVNSKFLAATANCGPRDWALLLHVDRLYDRVYLLDSAARSAHRLSEPPRERSGTEVPWPVVWLLGGHSRKFVYLNGRMPTLQHLREDVWKCIHRLRWRWHFEYAVSTRSERHPLSAVLPKTKSPPPHALPIPTNWASGAPIF